jgi:hypothetical protein
MMLTDDEYPPKPTKLLALSLLSNKNLLDN